MTQETTSFVLRFVREVSEEQEARWRGLIQHVQSGAERNFATFADAVQFMQGRVLENTAQSFAEGEPSPDKNPLVEMARMWGDFAPQVTGMWLQAAEQMLDQSTAVRSQMDQALASVFNAQGVASGTDRDAVLASLARLGEQVEFLGARVEELEERLSASQKPSKVAQ